MRKAIIEFESELLADKSRGAQEASVFFALRLEFPSVGGCAVRSYGRRSVVISIHHIAATFNARCRPSPVPRLAASITLTSVRSTSSFTVPIVSGTCVSGTKILDIINVPGAETIAEKVVAKGLSVRDAERLARNAREPRESKPRTPRPSNDGGGGGEGASDADLRALERQLGDVLGLKVDIAFGERGGAITINYSTLGQLDMVCQRLSGERI